MNRYQTFQNSWKPQKQTFGTSSNYNCQLFPPCCPKLQSLIIRKFEKRHYWTTCGSQRTDTQCLLVEAYLPVISTFVIHTYGLPWIKIQDCKFQKGPQLRNCNCVKLTQNSAKMVSRLCYDYVGKIFLVWSKSWPVDWSTECHNWNPWTPCFFRI